jgi:hypothetical protein
MKRDLVEHYTGELLKRFLQGLSLQFPLNPLSAVLQNYLMLSDDGTDNSYISKYGKEFYQCIKDLEEMPEDDVLRNHNTEGLMGQIEVPAVPPYKGTILSDPAFSSRG